MTLVGSCLDFRQVSRLEVKIFVIIKIEYGPLYCFLLKLKLG